MVHRTAQLPDSRVDPQGKAVDFPASASLQALNNKTVGYESDLWALGASLFFAVEGNAALP